MKKRFLSAMLALVLLCTPLLTGCGSNKEEILIYTSVEDFVVEDLQARLAEEFPDYDITLEYLTTGNHAARLLSEGKSTSCDISYNLEYAYLSQLEEKGLLADLSGYDKSVYCQDTLVGDNYLVQSRNGGAIILNTDVLKEKNLPEPTSYEDLLKPEYKGLISMPNPKSSGTGYMFLKSLVNAWGEEKALAYFDKLTENILSYTSSGSGPLNALLQKEVAIGLGMTAPAVTQINQGASLKITFFEEGSPFSLYGQAMIAGKETRESVKQVFDFLLNTYAYELSEKYFPEPLFKDKTFEVKNFPKNIVYSDMRGDTSDAKVALLEKWAH